MRDEEREQHYERAKKLLGEQNFAAALVAGAVTTLLASVAYGITVSTWAYSHGFAIAGIGIAVGLTIGFLGRGILTRFGVLAALYTIIGFLCGNVFRVVLQTARRPADSPFDVLDDSSLWQIAERSFTYLSAIDLVYLLIALFAAVFFAKRPLSRADRLALGVYEMRDEA